MAGLIKKQILKHLSKFAKNLSADKINLSTFRGEGELNNLELDCIALQNVMNLPTWLQINRANCNRVHVKIPWTNLKKSPICIFLDAVDVEMVTCEKPREPNGPSPIQASESSGDTSYGFTEKVLEGMTVTINSISVNFSSAAFNANFQLSQLFVVSTNPNWEVSDLRFSRIQDKTVGQILTFKKMSWQTMRIVANAVTSGDKSTITPLRLITNQSEIKMTFRRKTSDCSVLASRLHVHFDDLLWVLTDSQVQSALLCVKSLRDTIERSSQQMRELGLKSQEAPQPSPKPPSSTKDESDDQNSSKFFHQHNVIESAIHLDFDRVDLHICEETSPVHKASVNSGIQGGAIQISLHDLKVDHYPYHKPASDRRHFRGYGETMTERDCWAEGIIKQFRNDFATLKKAADKAGTLKTTNGSNKPARLVENCLVVRLADIDIHQVTTSASKKQSGGRLINSTRKELHLPDDMPLFFFINTEYYYPDGRDFPAPHDNIFMQINAPQLHTHWDSLIWLNRLSTVTVQAVQKMLEDLGIMTENEDDDLDASQTSDNDEKHTDIRIQVLMPKIFIPGPPSTHSKQPQGLEIQVSKATVTNCRDGIDCTRIQLKSILDQMQKQHLSKRSTSFPSDSEIDLPPLQEMLKTHALERDKPLVLSIASGNPNLTRNALIGHAKNDVWAVDLDNIWIDFVMPGQNDTEVQRNEPTGGFLGISKLRDPVSSGTRFPFVDSFPARLWIGKSTLVNDVFPKIATSILIPEKGPALSPSGSMSDVSSQSHSVPDSNPSKPDQAKLDGSFEVSGNGVSSSVTTKHNTMSPRTLRNKKLLAYYSSPSSKDVDESDAISHDRISVTSTSSGRSKVISSCILLHTDKALRLQLDHYQYLHLIHLIDMVEDVGNQLDASAKEALNSTPASVASTPSHTAKSSNLSSRTKKLMETSSVRISAPSADLFLILHPPPPDVCSDELGEKSNSTSNSVTSPKTDSVKGSSLSSESVKSQSISVEDMASSIVDKVASKASLPPQDTPPLSECGSDTLSLQGSDTFSAFGDSSSNLGSSYPHFDVHIPSAVPNTPSGQSLYPHGPSDSEGLPLLSQDQNSSGMPLSEAPAPGLHQFEDARVSLSKQKSGSFSVLSSTTSVSSRLSHNLLQRNHSSDNLRGSVSTSDQKLNITDVTTVSKTGSSGYESGSRESLPIPQNMENLKTKKSDHSRSSSDASDQFVVLQVDKTGKGTGESSSVRLSKQQKASSDSSGLASETSSLSSQNLATTDLSKAHVTGESSSNCAMADSQITVTNLETESISSSITTDKESEMKKEEVVDKEPEMSSLALLHVSNGIELGIDSNDIGDNIVKIVAHNATVKELGTRKSDKNDNIFVEYSPKKCVALSRKEAVHSAERSPDVCLRVDSGPLASRFAPSAVDVGHLELLADGVCLSLKSSTLSNLGAFLEDDVPPKIMPMIIEASDVKLTINDDMPPVYDATPPADPITLNIHSATVRRTDDGTFHVTTSTSGKTLLLPKTPSPSSLSMPVNAKEASSAQALDFASCVDTMNKGSNEADTLKNDSGTIEKSGDVMVNDMKKNAVDDEKLRLQKEVEELKDKLAEIEAHRNALNDVVERMQEDLLSSERRRSSLHAQFSP